MSEHERSTDNVGAVATRGVVVQIAAAQPGRADSDAHPALPQLGDGQLCNPDVLDAIQHRGGLRKSCC